MDAGAVSAVIVGNVYSLITRTDSRGVGLLSKTC